MAELATEAGGLGGRDDDLVVETITRHAAALLRTARRYSLCADDAHDAYQRALEIFLMRAGRLRRDTAVNWLHQVVKHEALAVRDARRRLVASEDVEPDGHVTTPEERVVSIDHTQRAAEALSLLKPQEAQALWLRAQGLSYQEIAERQSWTYTKVNRCLTEGRKAFLERFAGIESGEECRRWAPVVSALVDGEASARETRDLRTHLRNCAACRSTMRELRSAGPSLAGALPGVAAADGGESLERAGGLLARACEALAGGLHDRVGASVVKLQAAAEVASAGKVAAVAASAAAIATGGAVTAERTRVLDRGAPRGAGTPSHPGVQLSRTTVAEAHRARTASAPPERSRARARAARGRDARGAQRPVAVAQEFGLEVSRQSRAASSAPATPQAARAASAGPAPRATAPAPPASNASREFGFETGR